MKKQIIILAFLCLGSALFNPAIAIDSDAMKPALAGLAGRWQGVLEYRDYQSNKRVEIPHERFVRVAPDGSYVLMEMTYTDPGYQVYAAEVITVDGQHLLSASVENASITSTRHEITTFIGDVVNWSAQVDARGTDADSPADIRFIWRRDGKSLTVEKLVRTTSGHEFEFRNEVQLELVSAE